MFARVRFGDQCVAVIAGLLAVTGWGVLYALPIAEVFEYSREPLIYTADVIKSYPHDPDAFTQVRDNNEFQSRTGKE